MFRLLLYLLFGYVIWRIVQTVLRMVTRSSQWDRDSAQPPPQKQSPPAQGFSDVKDARFEDLPPSKAKDENTTPSN